VEIKKTQIEYFNDLFRRFYQIHDLANQIEKQSRILNEISMNAAVASAHTGGQSKVFSEIANQIGIISGHFKKTIEKIHIHTGAMTNFMLHCIISSVRYDKFSRVREEVHGDGNQLRIQEVLIEYETKLVINLSNGCKEVDFIRPEISRLKQGLDRVWALIMSLKVSASLSDNGEEAFFMSIAESLDQMADETSRHLDHLMEIILLLYRDIEATAEAEKEKFDAA
jgi:hypothetical protein